MKHKDKNRDPMIARRRAVLDARCALRKLSDWAADLKQHQSNAKLDRAIDQVTKIAADLSEIQARRDAKGAK